MKSATIKLNKKTLIRAVSSVLSLALTANIGLSLLGKDALAATKDPSISVSGSTVTCNSNIDTYGFVSFDLENNGGYTVSYYKNGKPVPTSISNNMNFILNVYSRLEVYNDYTFGNVVVNGSGGDEIGATFLIKSGVNAKINGAISGNGGNSKVINYGTMEFATFNASAFSGISAFNNGKSSSGGTIKADTVYIDNDKYSDVSKSKIIVSSYFSKDSRNINAVVYADSGTRIKSTGGTFTLNVNGAQKTISGNVDALAYALMDDSSASLDNLPDVYVGQNYDFSSYMHTASGYPGNAYLEYSSDQSNWSTTKPTAAGSYYARVFAPLSGSYLSSISYNKSFTISYLPKSTVSSSGNYYTFGNVVNGKYVDGKVKVVPASGYKISCSHASDTGFADYVMLSEDNILSGGNVNTQAYFRFKRISDGAETAEIYATSIASPSFESLVFDTDTPEVYEVMLTTSEGSVETYLDSSENNTRTIVANRMSISIYDDNLSKVEIDNRTLTEGNGIDNGNCTLYIDSTIATTLNIEFTATDKANKSTTIKFKLLHEPVDPTLSVRLPSTIYAGDDYSADVTTNSDGKVTVLYGNQSDFSTTPPTAAGSYNVQVTVDDTVYYKSAAYRGSYTIVKRSGTATVSADDIYVGGTVSPVLTTESDGKNDAVYEYKFSAAPDSAYSRTVPTAAGNYDVRVTVPETARYLSQTCKSSFTIKKFTVEAEVSVADLFVGGKVEPVVTTESNGKSMAAFQYKLSTAPDTEYSDTVPTAAGVYTVKATIPETAEYLKIVCTSEFTISLNPVSMMNFTIKDFYFGQKADIYYTSDSDGLMTVMYKPFNAPDTAYVQDEPTQPGKYTARATVPATAIFESASVTTDFTISYLEAPKTPYMAVGTMGNGGFYTSDVELNAPNGYKISTALGGVYTPSIPYTEDLDQIFLKRDDGAMTSAIQITNKPKIDKAAPALTSSAGKLTEGSVIYVTSLNVAVTDKNLKSLTVNGNPINLSSGTGNVLNFDPGMGTTDVIIVAEDEAGNITNISFTVKAEWLENKVIVPGVALPLAAEESYKLDSGSWTVTMSDSEGNTVEDTTVYNGNMPVYVNTNGDYTFTPVT